MKKVLVLLIALFFTFLAVKAEVIADLKGMFWLKGNKRSSESILDLLTCGLNKMPKKFLRKEKISASYEGASSVTLESEVKNDKKLLFNVKVPSILTYYSVCSSRTQKEKVTDGAVRILCSDNSKSVDNTFSISKIRCGGSASRVFVPSKERAGKNNNKNIITTKKLLRSNNNNLFSIKKIIASRRKQKGRMVGTFIRKTDRAKGRFVVNFKYR